MKLEKLKEANELEKQIRRIERRIDGVRNMLENENYGVDIVAHQACASETIFEGDEARDLLRRHLATLTTKREIMIEEFERL